MKKLIILAAVSLLTSHFAFLTCRAAANDTLISFSTPGPDRYADGTTVLDGECYALVWTKTDATFAGIAADGKVVDTTNSAVIVFAPVAKNGRCPTVVFELDADLAARYSDGSFGVYLLDTRLANGKVGGIGANGLPVAVNGYGRVNGNGEQSNGSSSIVNLQPSTSAASIAVTTKSALPANAPKPQITSIKVVGANVVLTVRNTLPCLKYAAEEVKVNGDTAAKANIQPQPSAVAQGAATTDEEVTIIVPKSGDSGFFKVARE